MAFGLALVLVSGCAKHAAAPAPAEVLASVPFDLSALDPSADPCVDFYAYACGGWQAENPIPAGESRWSRLAELEALNARRVDALIDQARGAGMTRAPSEQRVGDYYDACMDTERIDRIGLGPIRELMASIKRIDDAESAVDVIADLNRLGIPDGIVVIPDYDPRDPRVVIPWISGGSLGMIHSANYSKKDEHFVALRAAYVAHLGRLFQLLGDSEVRAAEAAKRTMEFEKSLAKTRPSASGPETLSELEKRYPSINWRALFARLGLPDVERVHTLGAGELDALDATLTHRNFKHLQDALRAHVARSMSLVLPGALDREIQDFYERTLNGRAPAAPRAERCRWALELDFDDDLGHLFVARHFEAPARTRAMAIVRSLMAADRAAIATTSWLGKEAQREARAILADTLVVVDRLVLSAPPTIVRDDAFGNERRAGERRAAEWMARAGRPPDRGGFSRTRPWEVKGALEIETNRLLVTPGFFQPPIFDPRADDAVNYGALGALVGHELVHLRDDAGCQVDAAGRRRTWWSAEEAAQFEARAACFVDGLSDDVQSERHEIVAAGAGLRLAYAALGARASGPSIDGYTSAERFFLS